MKIAVRRGSAVLTAAGAVACAALTLPSVAKADAAAPEECAAARVTGLSSALDAVATGSSAGPSVVFGVVLVPLSQPLPAPLDAVQAQVVSQGADGVQKLRSDAPGQIDQLRSAIAPFATGNEFANSGVGATASALDTIADTGGAGIAPADSTLRETATIVRSAQEETASAVC